MARRTHHKIQELPAEIVTAVNAMLTDGVTYRDIEAFLKQRGHEVGKSSVARYGGQLLTGLEKLKVASEQVKAILGESEGMDAQAEEAIARVAKAKLLEAMMSMEDLADEKFSSLVQALARLQTASVSKERLRHIRESAVAEAAARIEAAVKRDLQGKPDLCAQVVELVRRNAREAA